MKRPAVKLAAMAAAAVVLAMVAAAIVFNLFIGWKVESDATADLEYALELNGDSMGTGRTPNYLILNSSFEVDANAQLWMSPEEEQLAAWFASHQALYTVQRVDIDGWVCYALLGSLDDYYFENAENGVRGPGGRDSRDRDGYFIAYIDTAGEKALVSSVNTAFAIIAVLGAIVAALAAYGAGRRIEQAQLAQKRFYENMSHELKTPLAAIRGYAEGAASGVVEVPVALASIERETGKMTGTIDEMLGLSRIEAGAITLHRELADMRDFVQDCLMPFEGIVRSRELDVQLDLTSGSADIDPDLLEHAFSNVLSNAMRHAGSTVRVRYDGHSLVVWNDGDVPTPDQLGHLFDRFYAGAGGSTGIGLAYAREIVVLHGFSIDARIEEGGLAIVIALG